LNATLNRAHSPNSHKDLGWETFTNYIIKEISDKKENVVFVLWGAFAQKKAELIDPAKHFILKSAHLHRFLFIEDSSEASLSQKLMNILFPKERSLFPGSI
jgi:hypothetical protein